MDWPLIPSEAEQKPGLRRRKEEASFRSDVEELS